MARRLAIVAALLACASIVRTAFAACPQLSQAVEYPVGVFPYTTSVADFNRDGFLDLVTAYNGASATTGGVSISLGNGNGTFASAVVISSVRSFASATADFNLDGKPDIAVLYSGGSGVTI